MVIICIRKEGKRARKNDGFIRSIIILNCPYSDLLVAYRERAL
jgi:hypothetical protein